MKGIRAREILGHVQSIGIEMNAEERALLSELDLIQIISSSEYDELGKVVDETVIAEICLWDKQADLLSLKESKENLEKKLSSSLYKFFSVVFHLGCKGIIKKEQERIALRKEIEKTEKDIEDMRNELKKLKEVLKKYITFSSGGDDTYCSLTPKGEKAYRALKVANARLARIDLQEFIAEREEIWENILDRLQKFNATADYFKSLNFGLGVQSVYFMATIASMDDDSQTIWERAKVIDQFLFDNKWKKYDRLPTVASVMEQEGDIEELKNLLYSTFSLMVKDGYSESYSTWWEASNVMKFEGKTPEEKYERFEKFQDGIRDLQWGNRTQVTGYIASVLGQKRGEPSEILEKFRELEEKIVSTGIAHCEESGIAAVILLDIPEENKKRAERFALAFKELQDQGWGRFRNYYYIAAALATLPGEVEDNVLLFSEVYDMLQDEEPFSLFPTDLALMLLGGSIHQHVVAERPVYMNRSMCYNSFNAAALIDIFHTRSKNTGESYLIIGGTFGNMFF